MPGVLRDWILVSVVVFLVGALLESNAKAKYAAGHYCRYFWYTWPKIRAALQWLVGLGHWKIKCPDCDDLGICNHPNPHFPHSCCGLCEHVWIARRLLPPDFNGNELKEGMHYPKACAEAGVPLGTALGLVGCGWIYGSFWQMLRHGRWRGRKS